MYNCVLFKGMDFNDSIMNAIEETINWQKGFLQVGLQAQFINSIILENLLFNFSWTFIDHYLLIQYQYLRTSKRRRKFKFKGGGLNFWCSFHKPFLRIWKHLCFISTLLLRINKFNSFLIMTYWTVFGSFI